MALMIASYMAWAWIGCSIAYTTRNAARVSNGVELSLAWKKLVGLQRLLNRVV
jgi:hypothetical protein